MILANKTYLPPIEEYKQYLEGIWERGWLTNNGVLVMQLEQQIKEFVSMPYVQYVSSGTIALQIAIEVLELQGEVITTPFSYVATSDAISWSGCKPVYVDIEPGTLCIDASRIEEAITPETSAIVATHVFGIPCAVEEISRIAHKYNLKVIYDAAHAFGVRVGDKSIFSYGDISITSLHATKIFHTVEGGALFTNNNELHEQIALTKAFGHQFEKFSKVGINGKNSELHAAMGLCNLPKLGGFIEKRRQLHNLYKENLKMDSLYLPNIPEECAHNFSYFPVVFASPQQMRKVKEKLEANDIYPRRYFYPSLNTLSYFNPGSCPIAEEVAECILCLPFYTELTPEEVIRICETLNQALLSCELV